MKPTNTDTRVYSLSKRLLDLVGALIGLVVLAPAGIAIAVAVRLDSPGPILFRQPRVGPYGEEFRMVKFRTMRLGNDESVHRTHYESLAKSQDEADQSLDLVDDPRVTKVGRFLRKHSIDEWPNLWNVVAGEMSLVGPRPLVAYEMDLHDERGRKRLNVKPGVTGLAQVLGRGDIGFRERLEYDLDYEDKRSLALDLEILVRTIPAVLRFKGT